MEPIPSADLPTEWERTDGGYEHAFLDCRLRVETDPFRVLVGDGRGVRELDTPTPIESAAAARDWALAVMGNVERVYAPDCPDVVGAALARTCGDSVAETGLRNPPEGRRCLLCGVPLAFFGDDAAAGPGYEAHLRYVDDEAHDRALALLTDPHSL